MTNTYTISTETPYFKDEDARQRERLEARYRLEAYIYRVEACLVQDEVLATLSEADILRARTLLDSTLTWLQVRMMLYH